MKLELEGIITCIHHSSLSKEMAPALNVSKRLGYSIIDVKVGEFEMRIIRPMTEEFKWEHSEGEKLLEEGDRVRIVMERIEPKKGESC